MLIDLLILIFGLAILLAGGETLVRGASSLARGLGVSSLAIGLTVVAFGTSAPELAVNVGASLSDTGALSFGNIFGSNMANIGLIVGLVAVLNPLPIRSIVLRRELPMLLLATAAASVLAFDLQTGGIRPYYDRTAGTLLLLFFVVFLYYTLGEMLRARLRNGRNGTNGESTGESESFSRDITSLSTSPSADEEERTPTPSIPRDLLLSVAGLAALIWGADLTVDSAVSLARTFEVSEVMIGLTMVAIGTSLPELVTALIALRHNKIDMAVGGVVGSNIFNTLLVTGVTAWINPMVIPATGYYDLCAVAILSLYLTLVGSTHRHQVIRYEGMTLLCTYLAYMTWRTLTFTAA